jgi:hypothetical protein
MLPSLRCQLRSLPDASPPSPHRKHLFRRL